MSNCSSVVAGPILQSCYGKRSQQTGINALNSKMEKGGQPLLEFRHNSPAKVLARERFAAQQSWDVLHPETHCHPPVASVTWGCIWVIWAIAGQCRGGRALQKEAFKNDMRGFQSLDLKSPGLNQMAPYEPPTNTISACCACVQKSGP